MSNPFVTSMSKVDRANLQWQLASDSYDPGDWKPIATDLMDVSKLNE